MYTVYVKTKNGVITAINSSAFLCDTDGWTKIGEGDGDRYMHAQGNYLPLPLMDDAGRYRYKLVSGKAVERTQAELDADTLPDSTPTATERLDALENETKEQGEALNEVLTILEGIV